MDLYNFHNSGKVELGIYDSKRLLLNAKDIDQKYIFYFKSMILYLPDLNLKDRPNSPIIFFESGEDNEIESKIKQNGENDLFGKKVIKDNDHHYFLSPSILCMINVQGKELSYGGFDQIPRKFCDKNGEELLKSIKKAIKE